MPEEYNEHTDQPTLDPWGSVIIVTLGSPRTTRSGWEFEAGVLVGEQVFSLIGWRRLTDQCVDNSNDGYVYVYVHDHIEPEGQEWVYWPEWEPSDYKRFEPGDPVHTAIVQAWTAALLGGIEVVDRTALADMAHAST